MQSKLKVAAATAHPALRAWQIRCHFLLAHHPVLLVRALAGHGSLALADQFCRESFDEVVHSAADSHVGLLMIFSVGGEHPREV
ncbi:MAG: hypothetical protein ACKVKF_25855 [Rhodobacterales bacterium]|jgi:hypothetical protein|tara:strand:- start:399 stop:650 length:252 start_codon:yes stop_codon:yes gene_type:complete